MDQPVILIDTREQKPLSFNLPTLSATLKTGDYSIDGLTDQFCIERKSLGDLVGTLDGKNRDRFRRECERMRSFRFYALIIDGTEEGLIEHCEDLYDLQLSLHQKKLDEGKECGRPPKKPDVRFKGVMGSLRAMRCDYNLHFYFTGSRENSSRFIEECVRYFTRDSFNNPNLPKSPMF